MRMNPNPVMSSNDVLSSIAGYPHIASVKAGVSEEEGCRAEVVEWRGGIVAGRESEKEIRWCGGMAELRAITRD